MQQFRNLEDLYSNLDLLQQSNLRGVARLRDVLQDAKETAFLSRDLATIKKNVPMQIDLEQLRFKGSSRDKMRSLFAELEFNNLMKLVDYDREFTSDLGLPRPPQKAAPKESLPVQLQLFSWK